MRLVSALRTFREVWRRHGLAAAGRRSWSRLKPGEERWILFVLSTPRPVPESGPAVSYRFVAPAEVEPAPDIMPEGLDARRQDERCLLQYEGGRLVGYIWVSLSPVVFLRRGVHLSLPEDMAYAYKTYTRPEYRGSALQPQRTVEVLKRIGPLGKRRLLCYVDQLNFASLKGVRKSGYEPVGEVRFERKDGQVRATIRLSDEYWREERSL